LNFDVAGHIILYIVVFASAKYEIWCRIFWKPDLLDFSPFSHPPLRTENVQKIRQPFKEPLKSAAGYHIIEERTDYFAKKIIVSKGAI
jgi:hypothetical protein